MCCQILLKTDLKYMACRFQSGSNCILLRVLVCVCVCVRTCVRVFVGARVRAFYSGENKLSIGRTKVN